MCHDPYDFAVAACWDHSVVTGKGAQGQNGGAEEGVPTGRRSGSTSGSELNRANHQAQGVPWQKASAKDFMIPGQVGGRVLFWEDFCASKLVVVRSFRGTTEEGLVRTFRVCEGPARKVEKAVCSGLTEDPGSSVPVCQWDSWRCGRERKFQAL